MLNFKFIKRVSFLFVLAFVLFSNNVSLAEERVAETKTLTKIEIKDVKIEKKEDSVKISAVLENSNPKVEILPFNYLLTLEDIEPLISPKSGIMPPSLFVSAKEDNLRYSLEQSGKKSLSLELPINSHLPKGNYALVLRIFSDNGEEYGYYEDVIFDLGVNQRQNNLFDEAFLAFDQESCVIMTAGGEKYKPNEGPVFNSGESPKINCLVKNIGNKEITVHPVVEWKEYFVYGRPSAGIKNQKNIEQEIRFLPGETKNVALSLPGADKPQVYQSLLSFVDANNESRSFAMSFRWTVGGNSARVDKVTLASPLKNVYRKGETISLSVDYFGSMDLYWKGVKEGVKDLENLKITATIKDNEGNICGTSELDLLDVKDGYSNNQKIDIALDKKCENVSYDVSLASDDKELAKDSEVLPKVAKEKTSIYYFYGLGLIFVIIIFLLRKFKKNKNINGQTMVFFAIFVLALSWFSLAHSEITVTYPDDDGDEIRKKTVIGGTTETYSWGGGWDGGTLWLKASRGEGNERQAHFSLQGYDGNEADANFSDYFDSEGAVKISTKFKYAFSGCGNEIMYVRTKIMLKTDEGENYINFRKYGKGKFDRSEDFTVAANTGTVSGSRAYEIDKSELSRLYDSAKKLKGNPKVVLEYTMIMDNTHAGQTASKLVVFGTQGGSTIGQTFNLSDVIRIEIPLNLPAPSADLSLASISGTSPIGYNCKPTLSWTVNDVSSCSANGGWSESLDASNGTRAKTMLTGIKTSTDYGLSCKKDLGSAIGEGTYTDSVNVGVKDMPTVDLKIRKNGTSDSYVDGTITLNSGDKADLKWTSINNSSCTASGSWSGSKSSTGGTETTGSLSEGSADQTYNITCKNSCSDGTSGYSVTDSVKITCADCGIKPPVSSSSSSSSSSSISSSSSSSSSSSGYNLTVNINADNCGGTISNVSKHNSGETFVTDSTDGTKTYTGYASGDTVTLTATPGAYSGEICKMTGGWNKDSGGNCAGGELSKNNTEKDTCKFTMGSADKSLSVSFNEPVVALYCGDTQCNNGETCSTCSNDCGTCVYTPDYYNLTLKKNGSGNVKLYAWNNDFNSYNDTVDSNFQNNETNSLPKNGYSKMTAAPDSGSYFSGWNGCAASDTKGTTPSSDENACFVTMTGDKTATVTFTDSTSGCVGCGSSVKAYISARETVVTDGNSTVVTWTSDNADSCEQEKGGSDTGWISASDTTLGDYTTASFTTSGGPRTYKITCVNGSQEADAEVTISVGDYAGSPSISMWADPQSVGYKKTSMIQWLSSNVFPNSCLLFSAADTMNGYLAYFNFPSKQYFGSGYYNAEISQNNSTGQTTGKLSGNTVYKIQCQGLDFTNIQSQTTVAVAKPVSNFTIANTDGKSLVATIVEGLSANSSSTDLFLSGEAIGNVSLSASISAVSGAKAQFSSDDGTTWSDTLSVDISTISQVKIKAIKIPGATLAGTYNVAVTATDTGTGGKTKKLNVNLQVNRVSSEWKEF